jgi:hypothetical protein
VSRKILTAILALIRGTFVKVRTAEIIEEQTRKKQLKFTVTSSTKR